MFADLILLAWLKLNVSMATAATLRIETTVVVLLTDTYLLTYLRSLLVSVTCSKSFVYYN